MLQYIYIYIYIHIYIIICIYIYIHTVIYITSTITSESHRLLLPQISLPVPEGTSPRRAASGPASPGARSGAGTGRRAWALGQSRCGGVGAGAEPKCSCGVPLAGKKGCKDMARVISVIHVYSEQQKPISISNPTDIPIEISSYN